MAADPASLLENQNDGDLLRLITCGSVDDGKSTLIGRLLLESQQIPEDQMTALVRDSQQYGVSSTSPDLALLLDGLQAEREQGITIDVAYRFLATERRRFIIADAPGHPQYTRNMVTGASTADLAIILVDARKGLLPQTCRHGFIATLMGIRHVILAVNKMDLVDWDQARFEAIAASYQALARKLDIANTTAIPISALLGDNISASSPASPWYRGPALMRCLETTPVAPSGDGPFRFPVQWVNRSESDFRGYAGTIAGGHVCPGQDVTVLPSGLQTKVRRIITQDGDLPEATCGQAITISLDDEIDVARGDMVCAPDSPATVSDQFAGHLVWLHNEPMLPGRSYLARIGTALANAQVTVLKHRINPETLSHEAAKQLDQNDIGFCNISLDRVLAFDAYEENRGSGSFILIDRISNATVAAGMIRFSLRRSTNLSWQHLTIDKAARAQIKKQKPCILWFTGLSGAGKSTIANLVEKQLHALGQHTYLIDGDNVRHGLNRDLGFTAADRVENVRRVAETAKLFVDAGVIVLVSLISPFRSERRTARELVEKDEFLEVFVDTPIELCEQRDPKGLYKKARQGLIPNFTGLDSPYETPENPDVVIHTADMMPEEAADRIVAILRAKGNI